MLTNINSVLGPSPLLWLWPQKMQGDGLSFPVNPDAGGESAPHDWAGTVAEGEGNGSSSVIHGLPGGQERLRLVRSRDEGQMV